MTKIIDGETRTEPGINRRTILKSAAAVSTVGFVGIPAFSGSALADQHDTLDDTLETCGDLDIYCAIDTSGSLSSTERSGLETAVNNFIGALPTDGSVHVGTLEFGNNGIRNRNVLQNPSGFTVSVSSPRGNTPMPGALDIADQGLYGDANARSNAVKLIVLFTDGGPNYPPAASYAATYSAPRDTTANWSAVAGNSTYDNGDTVSSTVTEDEMAETALVAGSIKDGATGGGATMIATVYVGQDDDKQAMTPDAVTAYTDLPTYLESEVASSSDFAITTTLSDIDGLVEDLVTLLADLCSDCDECPTDFYYKFEWVEDEEVEGDCAGEFVVYDADDNVVESVSGLSLVSVTCDEDGEPQEACFETTFCDVAYTVKAGRGTASDTVAFEDTDGAFCVHGIESTNPRGKAITHAISHVVFTCPDAS